MLTSKVWSIAGQSDHVLVALDEGEQVSGYATSGPFRPRPAYGRTKETSVYGARHTPAPASAAPLHRAAPHGSTQDASVHTQISCDRAAEPGERGAAPGTRLPTGWAPSERSGTSWVG